MTLDQYDLLLVFQGRVCYICQRATGKVRALAVDHDHNVARQRCDHPHDESCSDCWRGLLCSRCNDILAHLRDDPAALRRGLQYLAYPPARAALIAEDE
jgi:hypothetical protein